MKIAAFVENFGRVHHVEVDTEGRVKTINIPAKDNGSGSSVNGGELLFLSLATCFCNDIYREASKRKIAVHSVSVRVSGEFGKEGEPVKKISYTASVKADATQSEIKNLIRDTDKVAEVQNTLRQGIPVILIEE